MVETGTKRPGARRSAGPGMGAVLAILGVAAAAVVAGRVISQQRSQSNESAAPAATQADPFADWEREKPPPPRASSSGRLAAADRSSPLWQDPLWREALALAEEASEMALSATRALQRGESSTYQEQGRAAKEAFDRALTMTAEWEVELEQRLGEDDPGVRAIKAERSAWFDKLRVLHKTTGR